MSPPGQLARVRGRAGIEGAGEPGHVSPLDGFPGRGAIHRAVVTLSGLPPGPRCAGSCGEFLAEPQVFKGTTSFHFRSCPT